MRGKQVLRSNIPLHSQHRILSMIQPNQDDECCSWLGYTHNHGRPTIRIGSASYIATRVIYAIVHGETPEGLEVRHTCDNGACVNPLHLIIGTAQDNTDDKVSRGRQAKGETISKKLTANDVRDIRIRAAKREPYSQIAKAHGITKAAARNIAVGLKWKHHHQDLILQRGGHAS